MWTIFMYDNKNDNWYEIGTYNDLGVVKSIIEHEIYLYNCTCEDATPQPRFKIESNFHKEVD